MLGLVLGLGTWPLFVLGQVLIVVAITVANKNIILLLLGLLVILGSALLGVLGLGQAIAALRTRGQHMIVATSGLIVSGLFVGAFIGLYVFQVWFL